MTTAWNAVDGEFYDGIGVHPKIVCWHARAWRHEVNAAPYSIRDGVLHFDDVTNNSVFCREGEARHHAALGSTEPAPLNDLSGIVFTQPTTERGFFLELFRSDFYVHSGMTDAPFHDDPASSNPISKAVFYLWWRSHQFHASRLLEELTASYPSIPVFVTPEVLPRQGQNGYSREFRKYYLMMMEVLLELLREKFGVLGCVQPEQTYDPTTLATKAIFAAPPPDPHHYSSEYVRAIANTDEFREFLTSLIARATP